MQRKHKGRNSLLVTSTLSLENALNSSDHSIDDGDSVTSMKDALEALHSLTPQSFRKKPAINYKQPAQDPNETPTYIKRIRARNSSLLLAGEHLSVVMNLRNISKNMDTKLNKQFHYFRREFLEAATSVGATVPLDILEDGTGKLITFIKFNGPKNVLEILSMSFHQEAQGVHLQRCGLSLLIVTVAILHRRLTQMESSPPPLWSVAMVENASTWAADALHRIADGGAVGVCVSLLMNSYLQGIQELSLNLLSHLVTVSEEAAIQMLQPPGNYDRNQLQCDETETKISVPKLKTVPLKKTIASNDDRFEENKTNVSKPTEPICVSYILSVATQQRNRYVIMAAVAEVMIAITFTRSKEICETIACAPTCHLEPIAHDEDSKPPLGKKGYDNQSIKKEENLSRSTIEVKKNNQPNNGIVEWAGLKILIKFLMRFVKSHSHLIERSSSTDKQQSKRSSIKNINMLEANNPFRVNAKIPSQLEFVHLKVVTAATCLIISSPMVASYALSLPGAVQAIRISAAFHPKSANTLESINKCLQCLIEADQNNKLNMKQARGSPTRPLTTPNNNRLPSLNETSNQDMNSPFSSNKIGNINKFSPQNLPNRPLTAPIESFSPTKRTSPTRPSSRQEEVRAPPVPYDMPEFPMRRGLPVHQQGQDPTNSLHTSFFGALPNKPFMPIRISQEDVKEHLPHLEDGYDPEASKVLFESIANKEIWKMKREGYFENGKHSVSIIERSRRVYLLDPVVTKPNPELEIIYPTIEKVRTPSLTPRESSEISNKKNNISDGTKIRGMELDITGEIDDDVPDIGHEKFSKYDFAINKNIKKDQENFDEDYDNSEINDKFKELPKEEIKDKINFGEDDNEDDIPIKSANFEANLFDALDILFP
jgi:hypothetical protein